MNNGYSQINGAMLNGLLDISANSIITTVMDASQIVLNGTDITGSLTQVPINTSNITTLQQITTGITYSNAGSIDLTTIDNNITITNTNKIKCATVPTTTDDIVNKLYCDTAISNLINSAPASLDTLNELAAAMGNDANFSTTVLNSLATKATLPILTTSGNDNLTLTTPSGSTGSLIFQTQGQNRLTIGTTQATFQNLPECSDVPTTGAQLVNKTYVDGVIPVVTNFVDKTTAQTIAGIKTFNNVPVCSTNCTALTQLANKAYVDSVIPVLTNYVTLNTTQNITAAKTLSGIVTFSDNGSNSSNIDQALTQFNITNNILNTTTASLVGIIPTGNTSCIVRTDAVTVVNPFGNVTSSTITGTGAWNEFSNNFFVTGTTTYSIAVQVLSLTQVQMTGGVSIGGTFTSYIGTRFALGTYIISCDLGSGVYNISQNALVASSTKNTTSLSLINLNRPFTAGGALTSTITVDFTTSTNIQCLNTSSLLLNAISIKPKDTISDVTMYGNLNLQGSLLYNYGGTITSTRTLVQPLSQFYLLQQTVAITITLPTANPSITGTKLVFKRLAGQFNTTFNQTGGASSMYATLAVLPAVSIVMVAATYQCNFICAGTYWFQMV